MRAEAIVIAVVGIAILTEPGRPALWRLLRKNLYLQVMILALAMGAIAFVVTVSIDAGRIQKLEARQ